MRTACSTGEDNAQHYFVATQDKDLRDSLGQMLGGATLFLSVNGIHIAQPTKAQKALAEQVSSIRLEATVRSCFMLSVLVILVKKFCNDKLDLAFRVTLHVYCHSALKAIHEIYMPLLEVSLGNTHV